MLTLLADLSGYFSPLNVFRYITFRAAMAAATALFCVFFFAPETIAALRQRQGKGQPIRADGPQSHLLTKKGTPTMGGLMILFGLMVATLLWGNLRNYYVWIVLFVTASFGAIGFYDDYLKVTKQSHAGFSGKARLALGRRRKHVEARHSHGQGLHRLVGCILPRFRRLRHRRGG